MSTKNESKRMSRWGDSDSDDDDERLPRASSFVNVPQIGLHDKEPQDNHNHHPSSCSMPSRNSHGSMNQKRHPKLNRNTKQATKGGKGRAGGAKSNGRNADWREMARNSQKYGTTNGTYST